MQDLLHFKTVSASPLSTKEEIDDASSKLKSSRYNFKKEVRAGLADGRDARDSFLHNIISDPSAVFRRLRASAKSSGPVFKRIQVGDKVYTNEMVADGMFDSLNPIGPVGVGGGVGHPQQWNN